MKKNLLNIILLFVCLIISGKLNAQCAVAGTASATLDSVCTGVTTTLLLTGSNGNIQWQSYNGSAWVNEIGAGYNTANYAVTPSATTDYRAYVTLTGCPDDSSNVISIVVGIAAPIGTGATRCGFGSITLNATGSGVIKWYDSPTSTNPLAIGNNFTTNVVTTTTFYAANTSNGGANGVTPMPAQATTFSNFARGYWFTAPSNFTITGLQVPLGGTAQSIAVVRFDPGTTPQLYPTLTNTFTTLFLTQANTNTGVLPVNIQIFAGDVIGLLGVVDDVNSYASSPNTTIIDGQTVTIERMGMQFPLSSTAPIDLWTETGGNISRVEITYEVGCESARTPVIATVTSSTPATITATSTAICISGNSTLAVNSSNPNYNYTWSPATGLNTTTGSTVIASPTTPTTYTVVGVDGSCGAIDSVFIDVGPLSVAGSAVATADTVCSGTQAVFTLTGNTGNIQWQANTGGGYTNIAGATGNVLQINPTQSGTYIAVVTSGGCPSDTSNALSVGVITVTAPTTVNDTLCAPGTADLTAAGSGTLNWYDAPTGGSQVFSGTNYSFNAVAPITYYVESADGGGRKHVGPPNRGFGTQNNNNIVGNGLLFDVTKNCTIDSVLVYPATGAAGSVTINLLDNTGTQINTVTYNYPVNSFVLRVPVGFAVTPGTGYQLVNGGGTDNYYYNTTNATYPYTTISCPVTITGTTTGSTTNYFYFYDWVVKDGCTSTRTPVSVIFNGTLPQPTISAAGSTLTSSAAPNYQWYLNGVPIPGATNQSYNAAQPGSYTVAVTDQSSGCVSFSDPFVVVGINDLNVDDDVVTVFPNPSNGLFNIQFTKTVKGAADVSISNTIGQVVYKTTVVSPAGQIVQIDNDLAKGTYFVTIQTINEVKQIPLVIH